MKEGGEKGGNSKSEKSEGEIEVGGSQMDFKKLSKYILILGIVICALGVIVFLANLPMYSVGGGFYGPLAAHDENLFRSIRRSNATKAVVAGAIVIFVGIAVKSCTKGLNFNLMQGKTWSLLEGNGRKGYKFCTQCGSKNDTGNEFCSDCGSKFS